MPFCAPQIVFSQSWLNQDANIASTDIFTPSADGLYRITLLTGGPGQSLANAGLSIQLQWNDKYANPGQLNAGLETWYNPAFNSPPFHAQGGVIWTYGVLQAGNSISLQSSFNSGAFDYDVTVIIEQLA